MNDKLRERGWSVADLARAMGGGNDKNLLDRLYKYTAGEVDSPRGRTIPDIASALGMTESELRTGEKAGYSPAPEVFGQRDLRVYAAVEGGAGEMVVSTDPIDLVPRPWYMGEVRDGYAVLVVGESMSPVFEPGQIAIVNPRRPARRGDDVILVSGEEDGEFRASIKRLVTWTASEWKVQQFNPKREFPMSRREWTKAIPVVGKYYG